MSVQLDHATITLWSTVVELPWDSRTQLIDEMSHLDSADTTIRAFNVAGASSPVRLARFDKELLVQVIDTWVDDVNADELPLGVWELRCALLDDLQVSPG